MSTSQIVTFFLNSPESRAWVVVDGDEDPSRVVEMWNGYPNHWSASMWLTPGEYRCRYYCGDEAHVVYHGPARIDGKTSDVKVAKAERLDVAICDINLWDGDGCDLLGKLKTLQPIKAIAMTGYTLPEETEHYRDAGFSLVLHKPLIHSEIRSAISRLYAPAPGFGAGDRMQ